MDMIVISEMRYLLISIVIFYQSCFEYSLFSKVSKLSKIYMYYRVSMNQKAFWSL